MPRKRIHELAKEWGMDTRYLLTRLEELGFPGKRAQSTLTDQEIALVRPEGGAPALTPVVGEEKVVAERMVTEVSQQSDHVVTAREEVRESRIRPNVIRRRTTRVEVAPEEESPLAAPLPVASAPEPLAFDEPFVAPSLASDFSLAEPLPTGSVEIAPELPAPPATPEIPSPPPPAVAMREEQPVTEPAGFKSPAAENAPMGGISPARGFTEPHVGKAAVPSPASVPVGVKSVPPAPPHGQPIPSARAEAAGGATIRTGGVAPGAPAAVEPSRPSRVLGRIDLGKLAAERPRSEPRAQRPPSVSTPTSASGPGGAAAREPAHEQPARDPAAAGGAGTGAAGKRPKKRKVIRKPETVEVQERDLRLVRGTKKKRALPGKEQRQTEITVPKASKRVIRISEVVTVGDLARSLGAKAGEVIKKLISLGVMATINQVLDADTASLVAADFDYTVENVAFDVESALEVGHEGHEDEEKLEPRPPVVTIMGHVDHGKTSLLDAIRETNVTAQEHGGITQHIGAYSVQVGGRSVTFLDTPGHEAFTAMRARGAEVTDIVVLVVAADDGVMPQTVEAVNHAKAAEVPVIVAVNKIDKPSADLERVKRELMTHGLVSEEYGGETIFAPVSAKTGEGIPHLLEMILLQADVMELRANPDKLARGTIVEAKLDRGRGPVATVLVQEGVLKGGDAFVCGIQYGRVRAMIDSWGNKVEHVSPSVPVEILGLTGVPEAGDRFIVLGDEASARQIAEHRRTKRRETELTKSSGRSTLEEFYQQVQAGEVKELRVIVKADVQGSAEAVSDSLNRLSTKEVKLTILHTSVGGISESDVLLASASKGIVIGFNVRAESKATQLAEREGVEIRLYNIIYEVIEDIRAALEGMLEPTYREKPLGRAEVRQVFPVSRLGLAAGCLVTEGRLLRNALIRVVRERQVVHQGRIGSLRRFKDDVREVVSGTECGVVFENFQDPRAGDVIEAYELEQVLRRLETRPQEPERKVS